MKINPLNQFECGDNGAAQATGCRGQPLPTESRGHPWQGSPLLLRVVLALGALMALASAGHYAYGEMQTQAMAQPQERELYKHHEQYESALHEDRSVHQQDLDNRADMLGVEQDLFRGTTNFTDPGYRDLPNAPQMQLVQPSENDRRTATGNHP